MRLTQQGEYMKKSIILTLIFTVLLGIPTFASAKEPVNYDKIKVLIDDENVEELRNYLFQYPNEFDTILRTKITQNGFYFTKGWKEDFCQVPLHYAAATGRQKIVDLFLELAPDIIDLPDPVNNATPLWCANFTNQEDVVNRLDFYGAKLDVTDTLGYDPLLISIDKGYINLLTYYISRGVKFIYRTTYPSYKNINGDTALHAFFHRRYIYDDFGKMNEEYIFNAIMQMHEAEDKDFRTQDEKGQTPLMYAVSKNKRDYVNAIKNQELSMRGNDNLLDIKDNRGYTACNYAVEYEDNLKKADKEAKKDLKAAIDAKWNNLGDDMAPYDKRINQLNQKRNDIEKELRENRDVQILVCGTKKVLGIKKADIVRVQNKFKDLVSEL